MKEKEQWSIAGKEACVDVLCFPGFRSILIFFKYTDRRIVLAIRGTSSIYLYLEILLIFLVLSWKLDKSMCFVPFITNTVLYALGCTLLKDVSKQHFLFSYSVMSWIAF